MQCALCAQATDRKKMAIYHIRARMINRSEGSPVNALAYVTGTLLKCQRTLTHFDHRHKPVQIVQILLPEDAPQWAQGLQNLVSINHQKGIQQLSDIANAAEKRKDSQVYRELEFALPRELTDAQNIKLAEEFIQDQCCKMGILAVLSFHFDVDEEEGERFPHCHVILLTRRLTEQGLELKKERAWNSRSLYESWREQWAAYANFHLRLNGFEVNLDHRSYKERGIGLEPQSKLGRNLQEKEARAGVNVQSLPQDQKITSTTIKGQEFQQAKLRNIYRLMARPEIVFDIITEYQSTFMWGDVQKVLTRYIDDIELFQRLDTQLKESKELVVLKEIQRQAHRTDIKDSFVYTSRSMLRKEQKLVQLAETLHNRKTHPIKAKHLIKTVAHYNQKYTWYGGLSPDQIQAIEHMVSSKQLSCVVGYAGAGKTTALEAAKEIWEKSGYAVYGVTPTGRASEKLKENSFKSFTLDKFLNSYEQGRFQFKSKSILVLDEGGMANTDRMQRFLGAVKRLGVKVVIVGDGSQLQAVEAGPAFRLVTERVPYVKLEHIVRQKQDWQKEATVLFGQNKAREALLKYYEHGCIKVCAETVIDLETLKSQKDYRGIVSLYNISRRIAGNIYHEMEADLSKLYPNERDLWKYQKTHQDYSVFKYWQNQRQGCVRTILDNLEDFRNYMKELGVDSVSFALNCADKDLERDEQLRQAHRLAQAWQLPKLDPRQSQHTCDPRSDTKKAMVQNWYRSYQENPNIFKLMMAYSNKDVQDLNDQARFLMKQEGVVAQEEYRYNIHREDEDEFGNSIIHKEERIFARGDRLIFTRNDNGLKVSNGTLGTIIALTKHKLKVKLDTTQELISFAPKLYPFFDQGWAATIHKNQSVTTKQALVLGTFEMFRNLTDVGMTRHEDSVELYTSNLDFWREEKLYDRLARSQEKLSSLDYVNAEEVNQLIKQDHDIISRAFTRVKNQASAATYISKRVFNHWAEKLLGYSASNNTAVPIAQASLDESERARILFERDQKRGEPLLEKGENHDPTKVTKSMTTQKSNTQRSRKHLTPTTDVMKLIEEVNQSIDIGQLARSLISNLKKETTKELKFSGGISVNKEERNWYSFTESIGGGAYGLIKHFAETKDARQTLSIARDYCHSPSTIAAIDTFLDGRTFDRQESIQKPSITHEQKYAHLKQDQQQKLTDIKSIVERSQPIAGTQAETYLRKERGIAGDIPDTIRYIPAGTYFNYKGKQHQVFSGAFLSLAHNENGALHAVQLTAIQNGKRLYDQTGENKLPKLTYGMQAGAFVALGHEKRNDVAMLAEGVETALSIKEAIPNSRVYAGLGINNLKNFNEDVKTVIICADWDGAKSETQNILSKSVQELKNKGYETHVVWPATVGEKKIDFNDLLMTMGKNKIKLIIEKQLHKEIKIEQEKQPEQFERDLHSKDFTHEITNQPLSVASHSWISTAATHTKAVQHVRQVDGFDLKPFQEKNLIDHYLNLKAERSQLDIVSATEQEKFYILNLRKEIQQSAFTIWTDDKLMLEAKARGCDAHIISDKAGYQNSLERERDNRIEVEH